MKESALQKLIVEYLRVSCPQVVAWHTPNSSVMAGVIMSLSIQVFGEKRGRSYATTLVSRIVNFLKTMGLLPGVPDLSLHWACGNLVYLELKTLTGKTTVEQQTIHKQLTELGFTVFVIRTFDQFLEVIREMKIPCRDPFINNRKVSA